MGARGRRTSGALQTGRARRRHAADEDSGRSPVDEDDYGYGEDYEDPTRDIDAPAGPYDEDEAPEDGLARLDLGSVRLPLPADAQVQVEMDPNGPLRAVHVLTPNGRFTVGAYAAPEVR